MSFGFMEAGMTVKVTDFTQMTMDTGLPVYKYTTRNKTDGSLVFHPRKYRLPTDVLCEGSYADLFL